MRRGPQHQTALPKLSPAGPSQPPCTTAVLTYGSLCSPQAPNPPAKPRAQLGSSHVPGPATRGGSLTSLPKGASSDTQLLSSFWLRVLEQAGREVIHLTSLPGLQELTNCKKIKQYFNKLSSLQGS